MAYSDFDLPTVQHDFHLAVREVPGLFRAMAPLQPTARLTDALAEGDPLARALNTEKARSELLIMPVLLDLRRHFPGQVSLFSGVFFAVDPAEGLTGYCDYVLSRSPLQLLITAPVAVIVEAKNENIPGGLGQCLAAMVAARRFNTRQQTGGSTILGAVTSGTTWRFLRLAGDCAAIDMDEYDLPRDVAQVLGILAHAIVDAPEAAALVHSP
jgi:hypothetical protein